MNLLVDARKSFGIKFRWKYFDDQLTICLSFFLSPLEIVSNELEDFAVNRIRRVNELEEITTCFRCLNAHSCSSSIYGESFVSHMNLSIESLALPKDLS